MNITSKAKRHNFLIKILKKPRGKAKKSNQSKLPTFRVGESEPGERLHYFTEVARAISNIEPLAAAMLDELGFDTESKCTGKYGKKDFLGEAIEKVSLEMQTPKGQFSFSSARPISESSSILPKTSSKPISTISAVPRHYRRESNLWSKENIKRNPRSVIDDAVLWTDLYSKDIYKRIKDIADAFSVCESTVSKTMSLLKASTSLINFARNNPVLNLSVLYELYKLELVAGSEVALDVAHKFVKGHIKRDEIACLRNEMDIKKPKKLCATCKITRCWLRSNRLRHR